MTAHKEADPTTLEAKRLALEYERACEDVKDEQRRAWHENAKPILEIISPGLLVLLDTIGERHPRRVLRLRRDLHWAYHEAVRMELLSDD